MSVPTIKDRFKIAFIAYFVLLLAALAFFILRKYAPPLSFNQKLAISAIFVSPIVLASLWEHLKGFKVGGVEISLQEVAATVNYELASAIQDLQGSATPALIGAINKAIETTDIKLVEVNLRSSPYWWSTRLYLLAALAEEFTRIERIVFVERDAARIYVGMASPAAVRKSLATAFPDYERVFRQLVQNGLLYRLPPAQFVQNVGSQWSGQLFTVRPEPGATGVAVQPIALPEQDARKLVIRDLLLNWMGNSLETEARSWDGSPPSRALYAKILTANVPYVPLLNNGHLQTVVSRTELALKIASANVG